MRTLQSIAIFLLSFATSILPSHAQSNTPVVFIPGFAGSYLCDKLSKARVWPAKMDHRKFRLPMDINLDANRLEHEACGIVREPIRLGGFRVSDVYGKFVDYLQRQMTNGVTVMEFSYDWRLTVEHNARQLRARLDRELPDRTVDIVAHSFGGLVARYFVQNLGGANRVRQLITMGTPHRGSADTFETLYEGWGGGGSITDSAINLWMGGTAELRKSLLSFPGFYDMLPNFPNCCWFARNAGDAGDQFDPFNAKAWSRFSFYKENFPSAKEQGFLEHQLGRALSLHRNTLLIALPGQHREGQRFIVTGWIDTVTRVYLDARTGERLRYVKNPGDGTVPLYSASDGRKTSDRSLHYSPGEHMQIFNEKSAMETVARTIVDGVAPTGGTELTFTIQTRDGQKIDLRRLGYEVSPGAVRPGDPLRLTVWLVGDAKLSTADLSNLSVASETVDGPIETALQTQDGPQAEIGTRTLVANFKAPQTAGAYVVRIRIPGLSEEYKDVFVVFEN